ncbi:S8 family serine peptidase [Actinoplanes sp. NPDC051494]|uniref:S8 family serine peptidase n=1 Tax=Actinoplanes sp. NPDC051494 TaxID=3363907 RepID=UPI0037A26754
MKKNIARRAVVGALSLGVIVASAGVSTGAVAADTTVRLVIGLKNGADTATPVATASALGARATNLIAVAQEALAPLGARTIEVPASRKSAVMAALQRDPSVAYVELDHVSKAFDLKPTDPEYVAGKQPEVDRVRLPTAWATTTGSSAVKIAVLDTGVNATGDLSGAVLKGYNFWADVTDTSDDNGHGTAVSSLAAGRGNNGKGLAGGCWKCVILPVKVLNADGKGYDSDIAKGVVWATNNGAKIINMSLGMDAYSKLLDDAVAYANAKGVLVVAAAGNAGTTVKQYPAAYRGVVAVGATARNSDSRVSFSSYNKAGDNWVDIAAPGEVLAQQANDPKYTLIHRGTSFASPMVAGAAGLIKSFHPGYNNWSLSRALLVSGRKISNDGWATHGMLDVGKAMTIKSDKTAPRIGAVSVRNGTKARGTVAINTSGVTDDWSGVKYVDLYVDNKLTAKDTTAPFQFNYNTKKRNNKVTFTLRAYDYAGHGSSLVTRWITADNKAPSVTITKAPKNKAKVKGTVTIKVSATDKSGVKKVELLVNGKVKATDVKAGYVLKFKAKNQPKKMKVRVRVYDKVGNVTYTKTLNYTR